MVAEFGILRVPVPPLCISVLCVPSLAYSSILKVEAGSSKTVVMIYQIINSIASQKRELFILEFLP
jgi:hypothetical protein